MTEVCDACGRKRISGGDTSSTPVDRCRYRNGVTCRVTQAANYAAAKRLEESPLDALLWFHAFGGQDQQPQASSSE
jgi:hypothetical protein